MLVMHDHQSDYPFQAYGPRPSRFGYFHPHYETYGSVLNILILDPRSNFLQAIFYPRLSLLSFLVVSYQYIGEKVSLGTCLMEPVQKNEMLPMGKKGLIAVVSWAKWSSSSIRGNGSALFDRKYK